jgi:GxxExxY protein
LEAIVERTIGCLIQVHRQLGPGLGEHVYTLATSVELDAAGIPHERERPLPIYYRDRILCQHRVDVLVDRQLVLEIKCVERIHPVHVAQVVSYLRLTHARVGLVVNFNVEVLRQGLRRVVL